MEKIILVDGNNLLFRSYYATAYNGNLMKNSKGFPTNALYGFINMMNKIIEEEKPTYIMVAFDKGKTFRHDKYDFYKQGRIETPNELKQQFPIAKEILEKMGIKYYEIDNYEADDIIGTFAKYCDLEPRFIGTIISSDKDLLQLISSDVDIKLLKQKDYVRYNEDSFKQEYGIEPINIIDLKALMGDSSDNIPGVKGIGEKTALKLLQQYKTLDGIYENIENITGKTKEKLINDKEMAYISYDIATIDKNVPLNFDIEDTLYKGETDELINIYEELEFYSLLRKKEKTNKQQEKIELKIINTVEELEKSIDYNEEYSIYLEIDNTNYHISNPIGLAIYNKNVSIFVPKEIIEELKNKKTLENLNKFTYDIKKTYVSLKRLNINPGKFSFDTMLAGSLLELNVKDDIAYLANTYEFDIPFYETYYGKDNKKISHTKEQIADICIKKAKFIYDTKEEYLNKIHQEGMDELYKTIELPLAIVLAKMELTGIYVDKNILNEMGEEIKIKIDLVSRDIYNLAGEEFNISSPNQLGKILFEKLQLPHGKKSRNGYSTAADVLSKLRQTHPIIELIIEYRMLTKLYSTYIEGLTNYIHEDGKIHTIYTQTLTRTGRLSSIEPNLQNIPMRYEYGRLIRKAFIPSSNSIILSSDYSQIELRILAHIASLETLIQAFNNDLDIHMKTASDIFKVDKQNVTKQMRRVAKAVNFGIIYGISSFGLAENLNITRSEAKSFIDNYLQTYPGVNDYMDKTIKQAYNDGFVKTLFNRKRTIDELKNTNYMIRNSGERMALNTPIQGTSADIIKKAMVEIDKSFEKNNIKSKMMLQVHDELVFDVLEEEKDKVTKIVKEIMENVYKLKVPLKVDIETGTNWYQAK